MAALPNRRKRPMFDLERLEFDEWPAFVIRVGATALEFEVLYGNEAFRKGSFQDIMLADDREALLFRSWAQALGQPADSQHECAGCTWTGKMAPKSGALKVIKATHDFSKERLSIEDARTGSSESLRSVSSSGSIRERPALLRHLPRTNLNARWEGIQTMLEMSDVGVFEFNMDGNLMHANEAYYRLR
jgi:PAS domain-containing protein